MARMRIMKYDYKVELIYSFLDVGTSSNSLKGGGREKKSSIIR